MADPKNKGTQNPGSGSPDLNKQPKRERSGQKPKRKYDKDKASEYLEWHDPEFEPSDISREQQSSPLPGNLIQSGRSILSVPWRILQ
jgi:hypothetical protein